MRTQKNETSLWQKKKEKNNTILTKAVANKTSVGDKITIFNTKITVIFLIEQLTAMDVRVNRLGRRQTHKGGDL